MGCWNETDMGTHLPILVGEECYLVVLVENPYYASNCYPTTAYAPVFAIRGEYNDYGGLEGIKDEEKVAAMLNRLPGLKIRKDGELVPYEGKTFEDFQDACDRDGLFVTDVRGVMSGTAKKKLAVRTVFLKPGFINLIDKDPGHQDLLAEMERLLNEAKKAYQAAKEFKSQMSAEPSSDEKMEYFNFTWKASDAVRNVEGMITKSVPNPTASSFIEDVWEDEPEYSLEMTRILIKASFVLNSLRMAWHIPSGGGSQSMIDNLNRVYCSFYQEEMERLDEGYDDF